MRVAIIGGDAAGMSAASRIRRRSPEIQVTVYEQGFDVSYSACGMPYAIAEPQRSMQELVVREAQVFRDKLGVDLQLGSRVESIDPSSQSLQGTTFQGESFSDHYDRLLLATGASPVRPRLLGFDLPGVEVLKTLEHGRRIKEYLGQNRVQRAIVVGMGFIALEMAESLHNLGLEVAMVKPGPHVLPWMDRSLAHSVQQKLESKGVELYPGRDIQGIESRHGQLHVVCEDGEITGEFVLVGTGIEPNSGLASAAGLELGPANAVSVDEYLQSSDPRIYAAGDCSDSFHMVTGKKAWIPLALWANRAGRAAGDNIIGGKSKVSGVAGTQVFRVMDLEVASTGINAQESEKHGFHPEQVSIESRSRAHGHPGAKTIRVAMTGDRESGKLLGVQMVGEEGVAHRINAPAVALQNKMSVQDFAQADLAYAPPFGPVWDPLLIAAQQLEKKVGSSG